MRSESTIIVTTEIPRYSNCRQRKGENWPRSTFERARECPMSPVTSRALVSEQLEPPRFSDPVVSNMPREISFQKTV